MSELNAFIEGALARGLQLTPAHEFLAAARHLAQPAAITNEIPLLRSGHGLVKIGSIGERLHDEESDWEAVHDDATGLLWTRHNIGGKRLTWAEAKAAAEGVRLFGHEDWRLPTIKELLTLVDYERHEPAIDTKFFPQCESAWYWSSTPAAHSPSDVAWFVSFYYGSSSWFYLDYSGFVRAVRASQ